LTVDLSEEEGRKKERKKKLHRLFHIRSLKSSKIHMSYWYDGMDIIHAGSYR
jgi:hypothetical protein